MNDVFFEIPDRRQSDSIKWRYFPADVLPMWVADMDFLSPQAVLEALHQRVAHGIFGYASEPPELREILVERMKKSFAWDIKAEDIVLLPGVVLGFNLACHAFAEPGMEYVIQTPVYGPFFGVANNTGLTCKEIPLVSDEQSGYAIDMQAFEEGFTDRTRVFLMCNPHNPVGRVFRRDELLKMAEECVRNNTIICSDEIHCDLVFRGAAHIPIASLSPEIGQRTVTLMAPSKTYNIAGLDCSFAIIQNPELRKQFLAARRGLVGGVNLLGLTAALAAIRDGNGWLARVVAYLEENRDLLYDYVRDHLHGIKMFLPEATYLAWLDCRHSAIQGKPAAFFLEKARVAMNEGDWFGNPGKGFVRINFGCPRSQLIAALDRMRTALEELTGV